MAEVFGSYTLLERIAVGGMAEVYLARAGDEAMRGRAVVVKRMLPQLADSAEHVTMFLDEAKLGTLLKHKNVVEVLDIGQIERSWFMALEYIDGPDLGQILKTARDAKSPLPNDLAAYVIARAAEGLHFAHGVNDPKTGAALGIIHRDVSPQNILVARDGTVKATDFGVAKSEQQMHQTQSGLVKGKIAYMSPEQISAQTLDVRTDVLALGVCLWEALTHKRLYSGLSDVQVMKKIYFEIPPLPSTAVSPGAAPIDPELDRICMYALARRKDERTATALKLMEELDAWCAKQPDPPDAHKLAAWMKARFVPRATVADAATAWAYKSPARGSQSSVGDSPPVVDEPSSPSAPGEATATTVVDQEPAHFDEAKAEGTPAPKGTGPEVTPRKTLPKGTVLRPLNRAPQKLGPKRDLVLYVEDEQQNWEVAELLLKKN
ncbi:MAG TPA: serine/threonine-protein kinase, partial [Myxococcota bacterium]